VREMLRILLVEEAGHEIAEYDAGCDLRPWSWVSMQLIGSNANNAFSNTACSID